MNELIADPIACPACNESWSASGQCTRCGLLHEEVLALVRLACAAFAQAREAALVGRFSEAREHLKKIRDCGIPVVIQHPAVERLTELCALASGDTGAQARVLSGEEQAAHSAVRRGDFRSAAFYAGRAVHASPGVLPLQKLYLLTLYGAGRMKDAAKLRQELRIAAPADADLIRWQMSELDEMDHLPPLPLSTREKGRNVLLAATTGSVIGAVAMLLFTKGKAGRKEDTTEVK